MVYESDFYTTRRPYRTSPTYSTYSVSSAPSRQVRILPGLGKVHVVHTYDRIVPYVGHKRLTVVTLPPKIYSTSPSVLHKEYDWIERRVRPWVGYSAVNRYLDSDSAVRYVYVRNPITGYRYYTQYDPDRYYNFYRIIRPLSSYDNYWPYYSKPLSWYSSYWPNYRTLSYLDDVPLYRSLRFQRIFDDTTRSIRAETASLLKRVHLPVPRIRNWPITPLNRSGEWSSIPSRYSNDTYIHRLLTVSPSNKVEYATYYTEPVRKYIGHGHLSCVSYAGDRGYARRSNLAYYEDPVKNDIQLLSYYINKFRQEKSQPKAETKVPLSPARPSRIFSVPRPAVDESVAQEIKDLREARAQRLARIYETDDEKPRSAKSQKTEVEDSLKAKQKAEEARLAEEKAIAEEEAKRERQAKKEEAARKAELARQEELASQAAAERAAELERQAEATRQEEQKRQAAIEQAKRDEEDRLRLEEERRLDEERKAEEERQQLLRLEEIARQAEEEKEAELARQAEELAELARQEAELQELERQERELQEQAEREAEAANLARQEAELADLEQQEKELEEQAEKARAEEAAAKKEEELAELARQEEELAELERQQAELDALEAEAKALEVPAEEVQEEEAAAEEEEVAVAEDTVADEEAGEATDNEDVVEDEEVPAAAEEIEEEEEEEE